MCVCVHIYIYIYIYIYICRDSEGWCGGTAATSEWMARSQAERRAAAGFKRGSCAHPATTAPPAEVCSYSRRVDFCTPRL